MFWLITIYVQPFFVGLRHRSNYVRLHWTAPSHQRWDIVVLALAHCLWRRPNIWSVSFCCGRFLYCYYCQQSFKKHWPIVILLLANRLRRRPSIAFPLGTRRYCYVESTLLTLLQRRNNVMCPVDWPLVSAVVGFFIVINANNLWQSNLHRFPPAVPWLPGLRPTNAFCDTFWARKQIIPKRKVIDVDTSTEMGMLTFWAWINIIMNTIWNIVFLASGLA